MQTKVNLIKLKPDLEALYVRRTHRYNIWKATSQIHYK